MKRTVEELKDIKIRLELIERKIDSHSGEVDFNLGNSMFGIFAFPFTFVGYIIYAIIMSIKKTLNVGFLSKKEQQKYIIFDEFNPCEYLWSLIGEK